MVKRDARAISDVVSNADIKGHIRIDIKIIIIIISGGDVCKRRYWIPRGRIIGLRSDFGLRPSSQEGDGRSIKLLDVHGDDVHTITGEHEVLTLWHGLNERIAPSHITDDVTGRTTTTSSAPAPAAARIFGLECNIPTYDMCVCRLCIKLDCN